MTHQHKSGGYRSLASFQLATIIYDATVRFCDRFIDAKSRLVDQMVQAARSGRQNIAEGSRARAFDHNVERRLTAVARASLEELLLDFEDFLRQRGLPLWERDSEPATTVARVWTEKSSGDDCVDLASQAAWRALDELHLKWYAPWLGQGVSATVQANAVICLIHQANYRLDRLLNPGPVAGSAACCPVCGAQMTLRVRKSGGRQGEKFWGCSRYPACTATLPFRE